MLVTLTIQYDTDSDSCTVNGMPVGLNRETGQKVLLRGPCFAALEWARKTVSEFDPNKPDANIILASGALPVNRTNGRK